MSSYYSIQTDAPHATLVLCLNGRWEAGVLPEIGKALSKLQTRGIKKITLNGGNLESFDTSAAWRLNALALELQKQDISVTLAGFDGAHKRLYELIARLPHTKEKTREPVSPFRLLMVMIGRQFISLCHDGYRGIEFMGEFLAGIPARIASPKSFRIRSIVFHINEVGIKAAPIIALMSFAIAFVTGYQGAFQLQKFDATIYTVDLVVLSTLREMAVLITAIMLAGRSGSAFAAQLGTMKLNEEVDALQTMGVSPFEALVMPRIIAIIISLPLLTIIADVMGLLGGYIFSSSYLGYSYVQFLSRMQEVADMRQFYVGFSKAPVFALLIGIVGCMQGLQAKGSAEDVGRKTITSVVQSIFLVIVADAVFSIIFTKMGI